MTVDTENTMITSGEGDIIRNELNRFVQRLDLTDRQQGRVRAALADAYQDLREYKRDHPNASNEDFVRRVAANQDSVRKNVAAFLTEEQLTQWDAEVSRVKEFLGQKLAA
jgi:hypothetical protein